MQAFYYTLGQRHIHTINGITWDKDGILCVKAQTADIATSWVRARFGNKWSNAYSSTKDLLPHFSKGIIHTVTL